MAQLHDVKVLLRAHGEPPSTYELARRNNIEIIDATCPVVLQLQKRIHDTYADSPVRPQIVIYGKLGHAEVNGLVGQTQGEAIVVEDVAGLDKVDFSRDIALYSQTTKSLEGYARIISTIEKRKAPGADFRNFDTICRQVANRVSHLRDFAAAHEVVLFVAGHKSSNGKILFNECKAVNPSTYLVANEAEISAEWLSGARSVGVCGATSTPRWLMENVKNRAKEICDG